MELNNPPHPGTLVRHDCLEPLGLTVTDAARWLGVGRDTLSNVLNGHAGISPDMALRLEAAGWGTAKGWLGMQMTHELAEAKRQAGSRITVKRYPAAEPA